MKTYSTIRVARLLDVTSDTLHRWIREKKIQAPPVQSLGGVQVRIWTDHDVERVRSYKDKHYWGKGSNKKKPKKKKLYK